MRTANEEIDRLDAEYAELKQCEVDHIHPGLKVKYNGLWSMLDGNLFQVGICMGILGWALFLKSDLGEPTLFSVLSKNPFQTWSLKQL